MLNSLAGTVFQTAALLLSVVPRLRPGLLSLRSVLPSRQSLLIRSIRVPFHRLRVFLNTEIFLVDRLVAHSFYLWGEMMANRLKSVLFRFFYSVFLCRFIRKG